MIAQRRARCSRRQDQRDRNSRPLHTAAPLAIIAVVLELISPTRAAAVDLTSVIVRGSSVYEAPQLFPVYREQLGKPIDQAAARAIAAAVIAQYERDGYSRPQVRVDDALASIGVLRIDVAEPRIAEVAIKGDPGPHLARLEELGSRLRAETPITQSGVQAALRRMRELPGLSLSASTTRDTAEPSRYRLDLDTDFRRLSGAVRLTNRGTDEAGPNFVLGQLMANGLLGGETNLGALFGAATDYDEYHGLGLLANVGIDESGSRLSFTAFRSRSDPNEPIVDREDMYLRDRVTIGLTRPLASVERAAMTLTAALDLDDLEIARAGLKLRDERLRMLEIGSSWRWRRGATSQTALSIDVVKGLDGMGSGLSALDLSADPRSIDFALARFTFMRVALIGEHWSMRVDGLAQQSAYVLPYGERFKIGGDRLGRGFEVAEIAGDQGIGAKIEGRLRLANVPAILGRASMYAFYDVGAAWKQDAPGRESAASGGFGFSAQSGRVSASLELAQPLTHADVEGRRRLALFAELAVSL
jgi:hemolysin activation/secretion protein